METDWEKEARDIVNTTSPLHFKVSQCKRYRNRTGHYQEKKTSFTDASRHKLPIEIPVTNETVNDVGNLLLKHFGCEWKSSDNLQWYKHIVESNCQHVGEDV
ncbi:hypothetical protein PR048_033060 [Dryococelus australis]|uniref:Uncharacterized protein n=1 Tax=Dryococelus australis TaxID=614101 RepID=A0ABQ9FZ60_9NEOP|nr:hypothetical protein PR048_033060 [Dryococelus australis]